MDQRTDGQMDGWMVGWIDGWMDREINPVWASFTTFLQVKLLPIIVLQKFCTYSKEPKRNQRGTEERTELPSLAIFAQQLVH
jgi:hypothetical protein